MQSSALLRSPAVLEEPRSAPAAHLPPAAEAAVALERSRIARDLHDGPIQALAGAVFALHAVQRMLQTNDLEPASTLVGEVGDRLSQGAEELRRIVHGLRPAALDRCGLVASVRALCDELTRGQGVETTFDVAGYDGLPADVEHVAYRVIQQALANVGAHAAARHVRVRLVKTARTLEAEVVDDGRGFDPGMADELTRRGRVGLASMQERAKLSGAALWIWSRPGAGTTIRLRVPLR